MIARDWNTKDPNSGYVGYVLQFDIEFDFLKQYAPQEAGGRDLKEYWIPSEDLQEFNLLITGTIEVIHEFRPVPIEESP